MSEDNLVVHKAWRGQERVTSCSQVRHRLCRNMLLACRIARERSVVPTGSSRVLSGSLPPLPPNDPKSGEELDGPVGAAADGMWSPWNNCRAGQAVVMSRSVTPIGMGKEGWGLGGGIYLALESFEHLASCRAALLYHTQITHPLCVAGEGTSSTGGHCPSLESLHTERRSRVSTCTGTC